MSLQDLAEKTALTKSYLSKVERGLSTPSVEVAMKLSKALHVTVDELFAADSVENAITIVRASDRVPMGGDADEVHSRYEVIAARAGHKKLLPFMIKPARDFAASEFKEHDGEEFLFVHRGKIEIDFASHKVSLGAGDAVYFNAQIPHKIRSLGVQKAEVLLVISADAIEA
ncbi:MAG TPA: XRE family transcriptional regulator [Pararobbsia sp.]|nr:XRE family transcriptional regulator [Pararobbsia sp.]